MKNKFILTAVLLLTFLTCSVAQQLPLYSQYMFNTFLINPAAAGLDGNTAVNLTAREQWLGLKGSPKTHVLSGQTRLGSDNFITKFLNIQQKGHPNAGQGKVGLGASFYNDRLGLIDRTGFQFTYAYHLPFEQANLSLGVSLLMYQFSVNRSRIVTDDLSDDAVYNNDLSLFTPDFNFGAIYSTKEYYCGLSIMQLTQSSLQLGNKGSSKEYRLYRHYYLHGGYRYEINRDYVLHPNALIKMSKMMRPQIDLGAKVYYRNDYWAGLSFRTGSAFILMGGVTVDKYSFGYAFDYDLRSIRKHSFGSHEVMILVNFGSSKSKKYQWLHKF